MPTIPPFVTAENKKQSIIPSLTIEVNKTVTDEQAKQLAVQAQLGASVRGEEAEQYTDVVNENILRQQVSQKELDARLTKLTENIRQSLASEQTDNIAHSLMAATEQKIHINALEKNAIEALSVTEDPLRQTIANKNINAVEKVMRDNAHQLFVSNLIKKYETEEKQDNVFQEIGGFLSTIFFVDATERQLINFGDHASQIRTMLDQIKNADDADKDVLTKRLEGFLEDSQILRKNPQNIADMLALSQGTREEETASNFFDFVDFAALGLTADLADGIKGMKNLNMKISRVKTPEALLNQAKSIGNEKAIVDDILADGEETTKVLKDAADKVELALRYTDEDVDTVFGKATDDAVKKQSDFNNLMTSLIKDTSNLDYTQLQIRKWLAKEHKVSNDAIDKIKYDVEDASFVADVMDTKGRPFETKELAEKYASEHLNLVDFTVKETQLGGYVVKGKWFDERVALAENKNPMKGLWVWDNVGNVVNSDLLTDFRIVEGAGERMVEGISELLRGINKGISTTDKLKWNNAVEFGIENKRWLTPEEFKHQFGQGATRKHWEAYEKFRMVNDMDYFAYNIATYKRKLADNLSTYKVGMPDGVKLDVDAVEATKQEVSGRNILVHDEVSGGKNQSYILDGSSTDELDKLSETHMLIKLDNDASELLSSTLELAPTRYAFVKKDVTKAPLRSTFINYASGGRRLYDSPYYIKSANISNLADGKTVRQRDTTLFAASSRRQAEAFVHELMESLQDGMLVKNGRLHTDIAASNLANRPMLLKAGFASVDDIMDFAAKKNLLKDNLDDFPVIQAVRDRGIVDLKSKGFETDLTDDVHYASIGGSKNSYRQVETISHLDGSKARVLDPVAAIAKNLDNTVQMQGYDAFKRRAVDHFQSKYNQWISPEDQHDLTAILQMDELKGAPDHINRQFRVNKRFVEDMITHKGELERRAEAALESAIDWALDGKRGDVFDKLGTKLSETMHSKFGIGLGSKVDVRKRGADFAKKSPISEIKGMIFNMKLGMFNPASFVIQAIHGAHIAGIAGATGWKGATLATLLQRSLYMSDEALAEIAKNGKKLGFKDGADFVEAVKEFRNIGLRNIGKSTAYIDGVSGIQMGNGTLDAVKRHSTFFFDSGERYSRSAAYMTARLKWLANEGNANNPKKLAATSYEGRRYITDETHRLMFGMTRADVQFGQRGLAGMPLQFSSYPMRATAALLGREFTKAEKMRMLLTYGVMYGAAGIPLVPYATDYIKSKYGDKFGDETTHKLMSNGLIDSFFHSALDADTNFAGRAGIGTWAKDFITHIKEAGFIELITGPAGQTGSNFIDTFHDSFSYYKEMGVSAPVNIIQSGLVTLQSQISTASNLTKTLHAFGTEQLISVKTGKAYDDITKTEAALMFAGIPPQSYADMTRIFYDNKLRKNAVKENKEILQRMIKDRSEAMINGDKEGVLRYDSAINTFSKNLRSVGLIDQVQREMERDGRYSTLMESVVQSISKKNGIGWEVDHAVAKDIQKKEQTKERQD